jgi:hypothetical protein
LPHPGTETRIPVGTSSLQATLLIQGGPNSGTTLPLFHRPVTLGRQPDNDLVVDDTSVSRRHALIMETPQGFAVRDLNTMNGTFINRGKIGEGENLLEHGDRIRLAASDVTFIFRHEGSPTITMGQPSPTPSPGKGPSIPGHTVDRPSPARSNSMKPKLSSGLFLLILCSFLLPWLSVTCGTIGVQLDGTELILGKSGFDQSNSDPSSPQLTA